MGLHRIGPFLACLAVCSTFTSDGHCKEPMCTVGRQEADEFYFFFKHTCRERKVQSMGNTDSGEKIITAIFKVELE